MGTVAGDIHDIGKDMVDIMLEGAGFEVIDLGVNVPAARFVAAIEEHRPVVVGMSAFLTTTMPQIGRTIEAIRAAGLRDDVRIIIGGRADRRGVRGRGRRRRLCARRELRRARHEGAPRLTRRILAVARRARAISPGDPVDPERDQCGHLDQIADVTPSAVGCEDCLRTGGSWVHLRLCLTCGHVGCCDQSPNRHATAHWRATGTPDHPVVRAGRRLGVVLRGPARPGAGLT